MGFRSFSEANVFVMAQSQKVDFSQFMKNQKITEQEDESDYDSNAEEENNIRENFKLQNNETKQSLLDRYIDNRTKC